MNNNGFATPDQIAALGGLEVLELTQAEFKDVCDARNGALTIVGLERLRAAAQRQTAARQPAVVSETETEHE
jgi:hypothetical protein